MQFQFKRPTTSKSTSHIPIRTIRQASPGFTDQTQPQSLSQANNPPNKWELAAHKINKEMFYHRMMNSNSEPYKLLTRIGGRTFKSQPKQVNRDDHSKTRIRVSSKQKFNRQLLRDNKQIKITQQGKDMKGDGKLKKKKRGDNFRAMPLERQLKIANIFYQNPVVKIGYNMQYDAFLKLEHISQIKPNDGASVCRNSIIFFLKDAPFSPNIISEKNEEMPISLSLFPEFFDSKLSVSHKKRNLYLQKMLNSMNNTYDPQRMAQMPPFSTYPPFKEQEYFNTARQLISGSEENYPAHLLEGIAKQLKVQFNPFTFKTFVAEQWQLWSLGNAMSNLDYILKDPKTVKKLDIVPYLPTRIISSRKVLYHGGYCKSIYKSWNHYAESGRKKLISKLNKYHDTIQAIHGWYQQFEDLLFYESDFVPLLESPVTISLFKSLQMIKIKHASSVLEEVWFRGALTIYHYGRYLQRNKKEFHKLIYYKKAIEKYVGQAKVRASELASADEKNTFYATSYENFIHSLRKDRQIAQLQDLKFCNEINESTRCNIKSIQVLLNIQLSNSIEQSFRQLKRQITDPPQPLIKLTLIIDRQTIKFLEQEEQIVNTLLSIISSILNIRISGFRLRTNFSLPRHANKNTDIASIVRQSFADEEDDCRPIRQYPQIISDTHSDEKTEQINLSYKTGFIFDQEIKILVETVQDYYRECFSILGQFEVYLPFIKLTTTQKLFSDSEGQAESSFLKNLKLIARYKESIKQLERTVKVNLFEVDCTIPIKILEERISQIEYIIEQNYINIIHERIEGMDSELNGFKIAIYDINIVLGSKESEEKLSTMKEKMNNLKVKSKRIAQMVMFCLDNKRKIESIISAYCQLVAKKQEIQRDLDQLFINIQMKRPQLEAEQEAKIFQTFVNIEKNIADLCEAESMPFELANIHDYLNTIKNLQDKMISLEKQIEHFEQWAPRSSMRADFEEKIRTFHREKERFTLIQQYWHQFYVFTCYYREITKAESRKINFQQFTQRIETGEGALAKVKQSEEKWRSDKDRNILWKAVIHHTHQYYSQKFEADLKICRKIEPYLSILTNNKIRDRHWSHYSLEELKQMSVRELCKLEHGYKWGELSTMNTQVNFQHEIYIQYTDIERNMRNHRLLILDLNGSDILSVRNIRECLELLYNVQIDIDNLRTKDVNGYYADELQDLRQVVLVTQQKLSEWLQIEQKYIKYLKYHIINEDQETFLFQNIIELHRKLIKSYDIDNSILFISKNIVMDTYLSQIDEQLVELERRLEHSLECIRKQYPRLYLLSDEELLSFMSSDADVSHYLKKLFPFILKFHVNEGSIEKIGLRHELKFTEPLYYQEMAGRVSKWVYSLEESVKAKMRQYYKTGLLLSEGKGDHSQDNDFFDKRPQQLSLLEQCFIFSQTTLQKGYQGLMPQLIKQMTMKIENNIKEHREVNKILLLLLLRSWAEKMSRTTPGSFEWDKIPQFSRRQSIFEPKVTILGQHYSYGFNYLEECDLIFTDYILSGNSLVGESHAGKTTIMKHYAYICGQELMLFDPSSIQTQQNPTFSLLNYFRVLISSGCWLFLKRIDILQEQQLSLIAQSLITVRDGIKQQNSKIQLNGQHISLNKNSRLFMSMESLTACQLPARLVSQLRPIWISAPNRTVLLSIYLQSKCVGNAQIGKLLKFFGQIDNHDEIRLEVLNWVRKVDDPDIFVGSNLLRVITEEGLFQSFECQTLLKNLRYEEASLSGLHLPKINVSLSDQLSSNRIFALYGPPGCGKTRSIINLLGTDYVLLNNQSCQSTQQFYRFIRGIERLVKEGKASTYLVLKNSLSYWPLVKDHLTAYKTIMIQQDLTQLHPGLLHRIKMIDYNGILQQKVEIKNPLALQLMLRQVVSQQNQQLDIFQLLNTPATVPTKIISKIQVLLSESQYQNSSPYQLSIQFLQLLLQMVQAGYNQALAFIFCIIWTYGFVIEQKILQDIFKYISMPDAQINKDKLVRTSTSNEPKGKFAAKLKIEEHMIILLRQILNGKAGGLTEMIPLKNGRLVSIAEAQHLIGLVVHCEVVPNQKVNFKSTLIYNLGLLRQLYPGNIQIDAKDWLTTFLTTSTAGARYCNFRRKEPTSIFNELFFKTKKQDYLYGVKNSNIIVDDLHLSHPSSMGRLQDLFEYGFSMLQQDGRLKIYKTENMIWTIGSKMGYPYSSKMLTIRINQLLLSTVFNEYIQGYCQEHLVMDRSIFSLLNISSNITRIYKEQQNKEFYWFKNPLILLQKTQPTALSELILKYFEYLMEILPEETRTLEVQKNMFELNPKVSILKNINQEDEVDNNSVNNSSNIIISSQKQEQNILELLLSDNEILEQIQAKEIEPIYFQKFINNYFTQDVINHTKNIRRHLQFHHLIILHQHAHPVHRIVKYAVKLLNKQFATFTTSEQNFQKIVVHLQLNKADNDTLEALQEFVKGSKKHEGIKIVVFAQIDSKQTPKLYQKHPFLKSHFLNLVIPPFSVRIPEAKSEKSLSIPNIIEQNWENNRYIEKLQKLMSQKGLDIFFRQQFLRVYEVIRKKQLGKFQFYRKITSEVVLCIDTISKALNDAPTQLSNLRNRQTTIKVSRRMAIEDSREVKGKISYLKDRVQKLQNIIQFKTEEQNISLQKLIQLSQPLHIKLEKIEKRIQGQDSIQYVRLKNNLKNNENSAYVQNLHQTLNILFQKGQNYNQKANHTLTALASPRSLASFLHAIRRKQNYQMSGEDSQRITTGMTVGKIKFLMGKTEEIEGNTKKYEKVSSIYKVVVSWISVFNNLTGCLAEYLQKQEEIASKIYSELAKLEDQQTGVEDIRKMSIDLQQQCIQAKRNLIECQEKLSNIEEQIQNEEKEDKKLEELQQFYEERLRRLQRVCEHLRAVQYMKKVSSGVSFFFKHLENIVFARTLTRVSLTQHEISDLNDAELLRGLYTFREDLYNIRHKTGANGPLRELQILEMLFEEPVKALSLAEDKESLFKNKMIILAEQKGYSIKSFSHSDYDPIISWIKSKNHQQQKFLLLHQNIHYLERNRQENTQAFYHFTEKLDKMVKQNKLLRIVYVTNYLPPVSQQFYSVVTTGKILVSRQRLFCDLCEAFEILLPREYERDSKIKKQRTDIESVIKQKNSKIKELLSNIEVLSNSLSVDNDGLNVLDRQKANVQKDVCEVLQNNFANLETLEAQLANLERINYNFYYLPSTSWPQLQKELNRYFLLFRLTDHFNTHTNNQLTANYELYGDWNATLRNFREEKVSLFTRSDYRPIINEFSIKEEGVEMKKQEKKDEKQDQKNQEVKVDMIINTNFRKRNLEIYNQLSEKIIKGAAWIQRSSLVEYTLGIVSILTLSRCQFDTQQILGLLLNKQNINQKTIAEICQKVLHKSGSDHYALTSYNGIYLISELNRLVSTGENALQLEAAIFLGLYYQIGLDPSLSIDSCFVQNFKTTLEQKGTFSYRYSPLCLAYSVMLTGEIAIRLTEPLNLSLNLEARKGQRQRLITIIEEERYLLSELVNVLKVKALSRKRELIMLLVNMKKQSDTIEALKTLYQSSNKYWVYLANLSTKENPQQLDLFLQHIIEELHKLPVNNSFRIFLMRPNQGGKQQLFYNKFQIGRLKSSHSIDDDQYYSSVNQIALQIIASEAVKRGKRKEHMNQNLGLVLIEQLIMSTINEDHKQSKVRLQGVLLFFRRVCKKYRIFRKQDSRIIYKKLVEELIFLGYFEEEKDDNYCQFIADFFSCIPQINGKMIRQYIDAQNELSKEGLCSTIIMKPEAASLSNSNEFIDSFEKINVHKIEEYLKNISSEFGQMLKRQIIANNRLLAQKNTVQQLRKNPFLPPEVAQKALRNYKICFGAGSHEQLTPRIIKDKLPLLNFLSNIKLKQICTSKKVDIHTSQQFFIFLAAYQLKLARQFMQRQVSPDDLRYSSVQFGNYIHTRDYLSKMKVFLVDEQNYQQISLQKEHIRNYLEQKEEFEGRFVLAIRKSGPLKMSEWVTEEENIAEILELCNCALYLDSQMVLQLNLK